VLMPPPGPVAPGAFDFQRHLYFAGIGAVGYAVARPQAVGAGAEEEPSSWRLRLAALRRAITARITDKLDGAAGAVAAALMTGERGAIPEDVMADLRDAGLGHLLAISGLHIGLVAGILFFAVRAGLALIRPLAVRAPIKKWAAVAALLGGLAYMAVSGATVPTQRATVMLAIVLAGVLLDRPALSMRLVAWAAVAVLLVAPESLLSAGFQMSFAAVVALVAAYEGLGPRLAAWRRDGSAWRRPALYLAGVAATTAVAGLATAPFAIHHFNRLAAYGLAANLVAVPLTALWIMPWALAAFALMPFGLEGLALAPMGWGIELLIAVARTVAGWDGAVALIPAMPVWGLVAVALGGLWLCLWRRRWRLLGVPVMAAGLATVGLTSTPDILISGDGRLLAVSDAGGGLSLSSGRAGRFSAEAWLRLAAATEAGTWPRHGASADGRLVCDGLGCVLRADGRAVAIARDPRALAEDCRRAEVVISLEPVRRRCPSARLVIDRFDLWRQGSHALWLEDGGVRVESARGVRGERPWVLKPERAARR